MNSNLYFLIDLNNNDILHRDLKPENILMHNKTLKLSDFGLSKKAIDTNSYLGTVLYMSPELFNNQTYSIKNDIWSLGIILYEMLFGIHPFKHNKITSLYSYVKQDFNNLIFPFKISDLCEDLIRNLLVYDQNKRFSLREINQHRLIIEKNNNNISSCLIHNCIYYFILNLFLLLFIK